MNSIMMAASNIDQDFNLNIFLISNMSYRPSTRRSRSPVENPRASVSKPHRSRSPRVSHHRHHSSSHKRARASRPVVLPLEASTLSKHDFDICKPMFGLYLEIQKQLVLEELSDDQVRGRWKSFVGKWYAWSRNSSLLLVMDVLPIERYFHCGDYDDRFEFVS